MKLVINILKYMCAILLASSLIVLVGLVAIYTNVLNESYIKNAVQKTQYDEKIYDEIYSNFENYISQSGLDKNVLDNVLTKEKVESDTQEIIENIFENKDQRINADEIKTNLQNNISTSLNGQVLTENSKKSVDEFVNKIGDEYLNTIFYPKYQDSINSMYTKINAMVKKIQIITIILLAALVLLIFALCKGNIFDAGIFSSISCTSCALFYILVNIFINSKIKISNIYIQNEAVSNLIKNIMNDIIQTMSKFSIALLILGIILVIVMNYLKEKKRKKVKKAV